MKYKAIALDDDENALEVLRLESKIHNKRSKNKVDLETFTDRVAFMNAVTDEHDLVMIDIRLDGEDLNGFDITKVLAKKHPKAVFMMFSNMVKPEESMASFLPKTKMKWSEILNRLAVLKTNTYSNIFDIMMSKARFHCA